MKPTIGRTVFYNFCQKGSIEVTVRPAIVTSVGGDGLATLHVLFEPGDDPTCQVADGAWWFYRQLIREGNGTAPRTWSWPPRV